MSALPLWQPTDSQIVASQMTAFQKHLEATHSEIFSSYSELHRWSIENTELFWRGVWDFCEVISSSPPNNVVNNLDQFPGASWFSGSRLNFAENLLRFRDDQTAIVSLLENGERRSLSYAELYLSVTKLAATMRTHGITKGDRIVGFMPNISETVIAMLATTSIGAIWSSCSPDFGVAGACDRFSQIEPRLLFTASSYRYNGKLLDCLDKVRDIQVRLGSLEATIVVPLNNDAEYFPNLQQAVSWTAFLEAAPDSSLEFTPVAFDHPLYIMYSSGTTGVPKCIVHGAGGTLLQHLKEHKLHTDLSRPDTLFYFTSCGWMMWNWLVSALTTGCTLVLYDGSPFARDGNILLDAIDDEGITVFGTSAKYIAALEKQGQKPRMTHNLNSIRTLLSTGSPLSEASFEYIYRDFKSDVCLSSISGGTDIISCFMLGNPNLPVYSGEIQCLGLGMATEFWDQDGKAQVGVTGELVCIKPFPSTPLGFWNDQDNQKFLSAYFEQNPGVWTHGDYGELTEHGGVIIQGRSDAVLNPSGVRIGTSEIYRQIETLPEVVDAVVVGQDWEDDERVVLFVVLQPNLDLTDDLVGSIKQTIRSNTTPRHVPAKIIVAPDIPRTISGKIAELAVRKLIHGHTVDNTDALANPETLNFFINLDELTR